MDANTKVLPFWAHLNSRANYPLDVVATDPQTGVINADVSDWLHPAQIGQHQLAEQVLAWIACRKAGV